MSTYVNEQSPNDGIHSIAEGNDYQGINTAFNCIDGYVHKRYFTDRRHVTKEVEHYDLGAPA